MKEEVLDHFSPLQRELLKVAEEKFSKVSEDCEYRDGELCLETGGECKFLKCPLKEEVED